MSTDWIEVHDKGFVYTARVFLLDNDESYIVTIQDGRKRFFKIDAKLLKSDELRFFENIMNTAEEIKLEQAIRLGLPNLL